MRNAIIAAAALAVAASVAGVYRSAASQTAGLFRPDDAAVVRAGADLYATHCAACHGSNLEGEENWQTRGDDGLLPAPPHDQTGHTWHHPDAQLFAITKLGTEAVVGGNYRSTMIGFGEVMSDDEIIAVLSYIKSTWPTPIRERHDEMNAMFEATQ